MEFNQLLPITALSGKISKLLNILIIKDKRYAKTLYNLRQRIFKDNQTQPLHASLNKAPFTKSTMVARC